jgi:hypothetical protein
MYEERLATPAGRQGQRGRRSTSASMSSLVKITGSRNPIGAPLGSHAS